MFETPSDQRPKRGILIAVVMVAVAVAAVVVLFLRSRSAAPPAPAPAVAAAPAPPAPAPVGPPPVIDAARVRALLDAASANPFYRGWVAQGDLVRRWVVVTDNLAEGVSPRKQLGFLAPSRPFSVVQRGPKTFIAPESFHRYDDFADAISSVNAQALAAAYRELHGVLEAGYRALGYPNASLDRVTAKALRRIEAVPVTAQDVEVVGEGALYTFADPRLENLGQVERQLLRMGPRNVSLVQQKARELSDALGLGAAGEVGAPKR